MEVSDWAFLAIDLLVLSLIFDIAAKQRKIFGLLSVKVMFEGLEEKIDNLSEREKE